MYLVYLPRDYGQQGEDGEYDQEDEEYEHEALANGAIASLGAPQAQIPIGDPDAPDWDGKTLFGTANVDEQPHWVKEKYEHEPVGSQEMTLAKAIGEEKAKKKLVFTSDMTEHE